VKFTELQEDMVALMYEVFIMNLGLYKSLANLPDQRTALWRGIESIISDLDVLTKQGKLRKYGLAELLEGLPGLGVPTEDTRDIPQNLKEMITSERYLGTPAIL
jgi:hypothetical protein